MKRCAVFDEVIRVVLKGTALVTGYEPSGKSGGLETDNGSIAIYGSHNPLQRHFAHMRCCFLVAPRRRVLLVP